VVALIPRTLLVGQWRSAAQQRDDEAAYQVVGQSEKTGRDRGAERQEEPAERPAGDDDRDQRVHIGAKAARNADHRYQRGEHARATCRGLRQEDDGHSGKACSDQQ